MEKTKFFISKKLKLELENMFKLNKMLETEKTKENCSLITFIETVARINKTTRFTFAFTFTTTNTMITLFLSIFLCKCVYVCRERLYLF